MYNDKNLKIKIKSYERKLNTNFLNGQRPKDGSHRICLSVVLIDSIFKMSKNYCPEVFIEECACSFKEKNRDEAYY